MVPPTISAEECAQFDGTISAATGECSAVTKTECDFYGGEITSKDVCMRDGELVIMKGTIKWDEQAFQSQHPIESSY